MTGQLKPAKHRGSQWFVYRESRQMRSCCISVKEKISTRFDIAVLRLGLDFIFARHILMVNEYVMQGYS